MSFLSDYEQRTAWKYEPVRGTFPTAEGLKRKVSPEGAFLPFPGTAAVFRPGKTCAQIVRIMQRLLHERLEETGMLARPLPASTIHMTLHDLVSPEQCKADSREAYLREMDKSLRLAVEATEAIRKDFSGQTVTMTADRIVLMVSKSLVLLMKPKTELDGETLLNMYRRFDEIAPLPYPLTPHITLAYFRPGLLDGGRLEAVISALQPDPGNAPDFTFDAEALTAQRFRDMTRYQDIPFRLCFCCDGGLNRSVLAAHILNHLAKERGLPMRGEARSAYQNTEGRPIPGQVWDILARHGIRPEEKQEAAQYLSEGEVSHFSGFAAISLGSRDRFSWLGLPEDGVKRIGGFFYGVGDPEYGEVTYEQAFQDIFGRMNRFLDAFAAEYRESTDV